MNHDALRRAEVLRQFGIQPRKGLPAASGPPGFIVEDLRRFVEHGFTGVKRGDRVEVVNLGNGTWSVKHLPTGNAVTGTIRGMSGQRRQPTFNR